MIRGSDMYGRGQQQNEKGSEVSGFRFEKRESPSELSIDPIETSKDEIGQPALAKHEDMFISQLMILNWDIRYGMKHLQDQLDFKWWL